MPITDSRNQPFIDAADRMAENLMEELDDKFLDLADELLKEFFPEITSRRETEPETYSAGQLIAVRQIICQMAHYVTLED